MSPSLLGFTWKRILRIYPALTACAVVCAFVIAPLFSNLGARDYLLSTLGAKYVVKITALYDVYEIPSVRFYNHDVDRIGYDINGSIWTIASEIYCYILLIVLSLLNLIRLPVVLFALAGGSVLLALTLTHSLNIDETAVNLIYTVPSFCAGVGMYLLYTKRRLSRTVAGACVVALIAVAPTGYLMTLFPILGAYPVIYLGVSKSLSLGDGAKFGDVSYGVYLYGWPTEQIVRTFVGAESSGWTLFVISLPTAAAFGWLSWHVLEKHALALKKWRPWRSPSEPPPPQFGR
jgi:peptidoglycan/LPS O-acetylase OafA/YrhL